MGLAMNRSITSIRNTNPKNTTTPARTIGSNIFSTALFISFDCVLYYDFHTTDRVME
mgnify:CR=1